MNILKEDTITVLPKDLINKALQMSKAYEYIFCIENTLRVYLDNHSKRSELNFPKNVLKTINDRKLDESKNNWIPLRGNSDLFYLDFKDLGSLIENNWEYFMNDFPSQYWIKAKLDDLARFRNLIAHNSYIDSFELDQVRSNFNSLLKQLNLAKLSKSDYGIFNKNKNDFIEGLNASILLTYDQAPGGSTFTLNYPLNLDVTPLKIEIYNEQGEITFNVIFDNARVRLYHDLTIGREEEEPGWFKDNVLFQLGQFDIDGDGLEEIFICVLDTYDEMSHIDDSLQINIFKYYPPALRSHSGRTENWELIGNFSFDTILGRPHAVIEKNSIRVDRNLRGFYHEWTYVKNSFMYTGNF